MAAGLGVPGLALRTMKGGLQAWTLRLRYGGKQLRLLLGLFPAVNAEAARTKAIAALQAASENRDPATVIAPPASAIPETTFAQAWDIYAATRSKLKSAGVEKRRVARHVIPSLGALPIGDAMTAPVLVPFLERLAHVPAEREANARGGRPKGEGGTLTAEANRIYATLRAFAAWARRRRMIRENPFEADGIERPVKEEPSAQRQREETVRVLSLAELVDLWRGLDDEPSETVRDLVRLLILVPLRRDEIGELAWAEYEAAGEAEGHRGPLLRIPAGRMKGKRPAVVPLSVQAKALLDARREGTGLSPWVFPGRKAETPFHGWRKAAPRVVEALQRRQSGAVAFTIHDIRRSVASALVRELGADELLVGRLLQHSTRGALGVTAVYQTSKRIREQAAILQAWADMLTTSAEGKGRPGNVVVMARQG